MLLAIAFLLFAVQIVAWVLLPSTAPMSEEKVSESFMEAEAVPA